MKQANLLDQVQSVLLLGPGPSGVAPATYRALSTMELGHLDPYFLRIMDEVKSGLRQLMGTKNELTLPISGTGSAGMEAAFVNLVEPGDKALVLINGVFGTRMADVAARLGAEVTKLDFAWGTPVLPETVAGQLKREQYDIVAMIHAETSTGVCNPVAEISRLLDGYGALFIVDAVTSLGGIPVEADEWQADVVYSGTQKCLSCPPGLSPITFSQRAVAKLGGRKSKVPNWYLDMSMLIQYWQGQQRVYHHTAPINMVYGLYQAIYNILEEGLAQSHRRHREAHLYLVDELKQLGLEMLVEEAFRLPMLNTVKVPAGVDEALIRRRLLNEHHIEIGGGLGPLAGQVFRIGLMGYNAEKYAVDRLIAGLKALL